MTTVQHFFSGCAEIAEHKICGMETTCAEFIREHRANDVELGCMIDAVRKHVEAQYNIGVFIGPVMGKQWAKRTQERIESMDIIICLLSDITNIDSKQVTFISNRISTQEKQKIWNSLYKLNFLK